MNAQDLKNSILQLAIEGKLVPQHKEEGTAKELLAEIRAEKARLIKEKKIKKSKPLPEITDEEKPFDIPESWEWVRLGNIIELQSGQDFPPSKYSDTDKDGTPYITGASSFTENGVLENRWTKCPKCIATKGDILLVCKGSGYGKVTICNLEEAHIARQIMAIKQRAYLNITYIKFFLMARIKLIKKNGQGVIPGISRDIVLNLLFPLPPLAEQHRIVAKIEELQPDIDAYDEAQTKLQAIEQRFPDDMKKSLLQYAIEGKLVPQRKEEGTAKDLLAKIRAEKARLVKEKKIKKSKPLPAITDDEKPFDIPDSWEWVRLGNLVTVLGGKRIPAGCKFTEIDTGHKYIRVSDMKNGSIVLPSIQYISEDIYQKIKKYTISENDLYITVAGTIGKVGTIPHELNNANLTENADKLVIYKMEKKFLCVAMQSPLIQSHIKNVTTKVGQPKLAIKRIENFIVPVPPLMEQYRIVAKLEELLPLCQQLDSHP